VLGERAIASADNCISEFARSSVARARARAGPGTLPACAAALRFVMRSTKSPIMKLQYDARNDRLAFGHVGVTAVIGTGAFVRVIGRPGRKTGLGDGRGMGRGEG